MSESEKYNSPSQYCKSQGLVSLVELSTLCHRPKSTLNDWWNDNRELFYCVADGAAHRKIKRNEG